MERGGDWEAMRRLSMIAYCAWCFLLSSFYGLRQKTFLSVSSIMAEVFFGVFYQDQETPRQYAWGKRVANGEGGKS